MKRSLLLTVLCFWLALAFAQTEWYHALRGGSIFNDTVHGVATTTSSLAGISKYVVGTFYDSIWFGSHQLIAEGDSSDIFIAKMDPYGDWVWAYRAGGQYNDEALSVATDGQGYIYVTGYFGGVADFGCGYLNSYGGTKSDVFVWKLDINGYRWWARSGGSSGRDIGCGISCDNGGNAYLTGSIEYYSHFGDNDLDTLDGWEDIFVAKIDPDGNWLWAKGAGSYSGTYRRQRGLAIHTDYSSGLSCITGYAECPTKFGVSYYGYSDGGFETFIARIYYDGTWGWPPIVVPGTGTDAGRGVWMDTAKNVYLIGDFDETCHFAYNLPITSAGGTDFFIAKYGTDEDLHMNFEWVRRGGGPGDDSADAIMGSDAIYVGGWFSDQAWFGGSMLQSAGDTDIFASKLDSAGNWLCTRQAGGPGPDRATGINAKNYLMETTVTVAGSFSNTAHFGSVTLDSWGDYDVFLAWPAFVNTAYGPARPINLNLSVAGNQITLTWDPVTMDTNGDPHPADYYSIYCSQDPFGSFASQGSTPETSLIQTLAPGDNLPRFYYVKAHYY